MILLNPRIILPSQHIFLVSHMRANTSVLSHVFGSNDDISGYYEMHTGYYSWKSLIKQKMMFHQVNKNEKFTNYYFDKILHNGHEISLNIANRDNVKLIFMLRTPKDTINSICNLYEKVEPENELATPEGAIQYYIDRLLNIKSFIGNIENKKNCFYIDAESIKNSTEESLGFLSECLSLKQPLTTEYSRFKLTGKEKCGDSSENINSGHIIKSKTMYENKISDEDEKTCEDIYTLTRKIIISNCIKSLT